jgi:3-keto-5-aminohexanoate cleavage enzyme
MSTQGQNRKKWEHPETGEMRSQYFPLVDEPKIDTLNKKLIVAVAPVGAFVTKTVVPGVPNSPEEIVQAAKDCYEAGASFVHIHCKTPDGVLSVDPKLSVDTLQPIKELCPGVIISGNVADLHQYDDRRLFEEPLTEILKLDPDIFDTYTLQSASRTNWKVTRSGLQDQIRCLEQFGIKPEIQCPTLHGPININRWLIEPGVLKMKPYFINMHLGKSDATPIALGEPLSTQMVLNALQMIPEGSTKGIFPCGRNWLPAAVVALTQGIDFIRVGFDDAVWMYPNKDRQANSTAEMVRTIVTIAKAMGLDIATPQEARKILGLEVTKATERARLLAA